MGSAGSNSSTPHTRSARARRPRAPLRACTGDTWVSWIFTVYRADNGRPLGDTMRFPDERPPRTGAALHARPRPRRRSKLRRDLLRGVFLRFGSGDRRPDGAASQPFRALSALLLRIELHP